MTAALWVCIAVLPAVPLALTSLNLVTWSRGRVSANKPRQAPTISVLIPARNEIQTIEAAVRAAFSSSIEPLEVIVYDDQSQDGTRPCLERLATEFNRLKILVGQPLPEGWVGKPHACHRLAAAARGELLVFVDADTQLQTHGLQRLTQAMASRRFRAEASVVSAVPRQRTDTFAEQLLLPLLHVTYLSWLWIWLVRATSDPRLLAANGQVLAVTRSAYQGMGGFAAVRAEVVDDMAFCRLAKSKGYRVDFLDGFKIATCRMYDSFEAIWNGFSKNMYEGIGGRPHALVLAVILYLAAFVLPYVLLALSASQAAELVTRFWSVGFNRQLLSSAPLATAGIFGVGCNLLMRILLAVRCRHRWWSVLLHPAAVMVSLAILVNSFLWTRNDQVRWAGRSYAARRRRLSPSRGEA